MDNFQQTYQHFLQKDIKDSPVKQNQNENPFAINEQAISEDIDTTINFGRQSTLRIIDDQIDGLDNTPLSAPNKNIFTEVLIGYRNAKIEFRKKQQALINFFEKHQIKSNDWLRKAAMRSANINKEQMSMLPPVTPQQQMQMSFAFDCKNTKLRQSHSSKSLKQEDSIKKVLFRDNHNNNQWKTDQGQVVQLRVVKDKSPSGLQNIMPQLEHLDSNNNKALYHVNHVEDLKYLSLLKEQIDSLKKMLQKQVDNTVKIAQKCQMLNKENKQLKDQVFQLLLSTNNTQQLSPCIKIGDILAIKDMDNKNTQTESGSTTAKTKTNSYKQKSLLKIPKSNRGGSKIQDKSSRSLLSDKSINERSKSRELDSSQQLGDQTINIELGLVSPTSMTKEFIPQIFVQNESFGLNINSDNVNQIQHIRSQSEMECYDAYFFKSTIEGKDKNYNSNNLTNSMIGVGVLNSISPKSKSRKSNIGANLPKYFSMKFNETERRPLNGKSTFNMLSNYQTSAKGPQKQKSSKQQLDMTLGTQQKSINQLKRRSYISIDLRDDAEVQNKSHISSSSNNKLGVGKTFSTKRQLSSNKKISIVIPKSSIIRESPKKITPSSKKQLNGQTQQKQKLSLSMIATPTSVISKTDNKTISKNATSKINNKTTTSTILKKSMNIKSSHIKNSISNGTNNTQIKQPTYIFSLKHAINETINDSQDIKKSNPHLPQARYARMMLGNDATNKSKMLQLKHTSTGNTKNQDTQNNTNNIINNYL